MHQVFFPLLDEGSHVRTYSLSFLLKTKKSTDFLYITLPSKNKSYMCRYIPIFVFVRVV